MKIHHLRNATCVIESGEYHILIDPMLSDQGELPSFARFRHKDRKNPIVPLPDNAPDILRKTTHCLITHSQKLGIKSLQHSDHLDDPGESFLRKGNIPVITREHDASYLRKRGLNVVTDLKYWQPERIFEGEITAIPALHGHGWIHNLMANGAGYFLQLPDEASIYISGDTVYTKDVERVLTEYSPDISVMTSGSASLDVGGPILMPMEELVTFVENAPQKVIANHLEALNHCPTTRLQLKQELENIGMLSRVFIPRDGETITIDRNSG
jgi:L-ascorbate metabolism protein UlaG (beta-lactamase superfamily)